MKLIPNYSYEFNCILNEHFNEEEQIKNFASLITDKDRFLSILPIISKNKDLIEKYSGFKIKESYDFFVVRAEKFKSFSLPITIEYSILPEEMILYLLKEILKTNADLRFPDEILREEYLNSFIDYICLNGDFGNLNIIKYTKNLHNESKKLYPKYQLKNIDFNEKTLKQHIEDLYN